MAGVIKVDVIEKSSDTGTGIKLNSPLLNSSGTEIMSAAGVLSGNVTFPSTIDNTTLGSNVTFPAGQIIQVVGHNYGGSAADEISWTDGSQQTVISETITIQENSRINLSFVIPIANLNVDTSGWSSMAWFDIYLNDILVQRLEHTGDYIATSGNTYSIWNQPGTYITSNLSAGTYTFDIKVDPYQANTFQVFRNPYAGTITLYEIAG